ncbi:MAG: sugar transferase [Bacilli bacterium]|nr:sugar transferase [Bacilli bacterium]
MINFSKSQKFYLIIKRINAILFSLLFIVVLSPIFIISLIVTLFDSKGHPFFVQERYGYKRQIFKIYKFTSMKDNKTSAWGRFIRFTSIDELPQLVNILKGDMTLIGPRPLSILESDIDELRKSDVYSAYNVKPGLTGYAQINYKKSNSIEVKAHYDSYYIEHFSMWLDIKILFLTVVKIVPINIHRK